MNRRCGGSEINKNSTIKNDANCLLHQNQMKDRKIELSRSSSIDSKNFIQLIQLKVKDKVN